jgi:peptide/nickel transport system permease protein
MTTETQGNPTTAVALAEHQPVIVRRGLFERAWRELRRAPLSAWFGLVVILLYVLTAIFAPLIAPYSETDLVGGAYEPWSEQFLFGTDQLGRDMLSPSSTAPANTIGISASTMLSFLLGGFLG